MPTSTMQNDLMNVSSRHVGVIVVLTAMEHELKVIEVQF